MDKATRKRLIDQYKDGFRAVADALEGATEEELTARPALHKWNAREIVHHLADSEMTSAIRLRLLLATDGPQILGYDQDQFARQLRYDRPHEASLEAFAAARRSTAELLDRMTDDDWKREGTHTEHGAYSCEKWLEIYATHAHEHAKQIRIARDSARQ
jgi:hypothetical protein